MVFPILAAFKLFDNAVTGNEFLELLDIICEMNFAGNGLIEPGLDDGPYSYNVASEYATRVGASQTETEGNQPKNTHGALWMIMFPRCSG